MAEYWNKGALSLKEHPVDKKLNLIEAFSGINEYFFPKIIGEVNDVYIKLVKVKGYDIPFHAHKDEDELFYVCRGQLTIELPAAEKFHLSEGEIFIVERGTEHRVYSEEECLIMLIENKTTKHTGDVQSAITRSIEQQKY